MVIAGEPSGDMLAAELVQALRREIGRGTPTSSNDYQPLHASLEPRFFGAGGPRMAAAGVELAFDMMTHSVIGLSDALKAYFKFRRMFNRLRRLALERVPDAIICVDFSGFNRRFAHAIKSHVRARQGWFHSWNPRIIQYVSPQVWASREGRAQQMARDYDLLLSIIPFEKAWYARRVPQLRVEFVGNPLLDRFPRQTLKARAATKSERPLLLLLPGSRSAELRRHLPVMLDALARVRAAMPAVRSRMILPDTTLVEQARTFSPPDDLSIKTGNLSESLALADAAIASTGTVTLECAYFGVPTVAIYKTSWSTYQIGKRIVNVNYLAMPNILANEPVFPEFIQDAATSGNIAAATLELLQNEERRARSQARLNDIVASLGTPGAARRAARAIGELVLAPRI